MKNFFYFSTVALMLTACSSDIELSSTGAGETAKSATESAIGFQVINRNKTRGGEENNTSKLLQNNGHYNFGVFAEKTIGSATQTVMSNYLVGYGNKATENGSGGGYLFTDAQTTINSSNWAYEKLGSKEYSNENTDGYYKKTDTFYMSNNASQYLKYWDKTSTATDFYAYAPYLNGTDDATASYSNKTLTMGKNAIKDGYDDASKYDFLYAHKTVKNEGNSTDYGKEVQIDFKRISAMIKIGFYEQIDGYKVKILDLKSGNEGYTGVCAAPSKYNTAETKYSYGTLYHSAGATISYTDPDSPSLTVSGNSTFSQTDKDHLTFAVPVLAEGASGISESQSSPSMSVTQYYLIPADKQYKGDNQNNTGLMFHVTYQLIADDSGETITVHNATVYIPYSVTDSKSGTTTYYCKWEPNHVYTYIFKITKATSGQTDVPSDIDPSDPTPGAQEALSPIIFDDCTVENWTKEESTEHELK